MVKREVMLAKYTPAPEYPIVSNKQLDELQDLHLYEVVTWPMHYPDELCMRLLRQNSDPNVILFIAMMNGITPIMTIGDHKAFIVDLTPKKKSNRSLPSYLNPSYNNTKQAEKHLRDQRGSV